ncbi:MAG: TIGR01212 family radical SAM protein [bacterium]|nr:TIGR01212 family radical SAM protein [bacterium]
MLDRRYNAFSDYLRQKFNAKVYKITIDAGFSCPNRDGTLSNKGCLFCDESGSFSQTHSGLLSIPEQIESEMKFLSKRFKAEKFMSYFQAYSNTYKPVNELEKIYKKSLEHPDIVGISIGTRPDCVDDDKLSLINSFAPEYYTWIEYGLQTANDKTLKKINRGHDFNCFLKTYEKTKKYSGINICIHVIMNLFETYEEMMYTAKKVAELEPDGVKIHMLCVLENTKLEKIYNQGKLNLMTEDEYVSVVCDMLEYLPSNTTIHRLAGNGLRTKLVEPRWIGRKLDTMNRVTWELERRGSRQGAKFELIK